jgi:DNA (cytosine-5)-methyltransferase 1
LIGRPPAGSATRRSPAATIRRARAGPKTDGSPTLRGLPAKTGRPRLLDLFCGAGGAAMGYHRAGFEVVGVDIEPQPRYPFAFYRADALEWINWNNVGVAATFDAVHASPPCQAHSTIGKQVRAAGRTANVHADLVAPTRAALRATNLPYVIENVPGAPLLGPAMVCGSSLGLNVRRHRLFETNWPLMVPPCAHGWQTPRFVSLDKRRRNVSPVVPMHGTGRHLAAVVGVHGHLNYAGERSIRERAMEVEWMTPYELSQAVPPVYTELIGYQLLAQIATDGA